MLIAHYTSIETALARIIPSQKLRFGLLSGTNDPYEVHFDWHLGRMAFGHSREEVDSVFAENEIIRQDIVKNIRIGCFSSDPVNDENYGCGNNTHLWTYYASAKDGIDKGCALIFDSVKILQNISDQGLSTVEWHGPIRYRVADEIAREHENHISISAFQIKTDRWLPENEYRIIIRKLNEDDKGNFVNIKGALKGIILNGFEFNYVDDEYAEMISRLGAADVKWIRRIYDPLRHEYKLMI